MSIDMLIVMTAGVAVAVLVVGFYRIVLRKRAQMTERVTMYTQGEAGVVGSGTGDVVVPAAVKGGGKVGLAGAFLERVGQKLAAADMPLRPVEYLALQAGLGLVGFVVGLFLIGYIHSALLLGVGGLMAPMVVRKVKESQRRAKFARQLASALMLLVNSLRSGYGFVKGLELVAAEMDDPISKELKRALREIQLGGSVEASLMSLSKRLGNQDLEIVVCAYLIQRDVGGNLTELMERVAETIRERFRIRGDVRALTAQGRLSGVVVSLLPLVLGFLITLVNPGYFQPVLEPPMYQVGPWSVPFGVLMLGCAVLCQALGALWIFKIVNIKV